MSIPQHGKWAGRYFAGSVGVSQPWTWRVTVRLTSRLWRKSDDQGPAVITRDLDDRVAPAVTWTLWLSDIQSVMRRSVRTWAPCALALSSIASMARSHHMK